MIEENDDTVVKYATAIHEKTASTEAVLSRFRTSASHPAYQGDAGDRQSSADDLRSPVPARPRPAAADRIGSNVVEAWNRANAVICYGKSGEISTNRREELEMTALCLHILQASLVYVNTLMLVRCSASGTGQVLLTPTG